MLCSANTCPRKKLPISVGLMVETEDAEVQLGVVVSA